MRISYIALIMMCVMVPHIDAYRRGKDTLSDVTGIAVIVDEGTETAHGNGLKEADLKLLVERKL